MKRMLVLGTILATAVLSSAIAGQLPQGPTPAAIAASRIEKVKDNLYVITGSGADNMAAFSGGNTAVYVSDAGVTLVDTKLAGYGPTILERVRSVTSKPVIRIINTHAHPDHNGSNDHFAPPVEIVVHENARKTMPKERETRTYSDRLTLGSGNDRVELYYFGRGHTNGDTFVVFPAARAMHVGDMFAWKALPFADVESGGSVVEHPASLERALKTVQGVDTIITGHIPVASWNDFREYAEFTRDFVTFAETARRAGKTADQAAAEYRVPARFKGYVPAAIEFVSPAANMKIAYDELAKR